MRNKYDSIWVIVINSFIRDKKVLYSLQKSTVIVNYSLWNYRTRYKTIVLEQKKYRTRYRSIVIVTSIQLEIYL